MRCDEIGMMLHPYMDGELTDDLVALVARHLLRCQTCAHEAHALEATREMLRGAVDRAEPSTAFVERTARRLRERLSPHIRSAPEVVGRQWTLPFAREELTGTE